MEDFLASPTDPPTEGSGCERPTSNLKLREGQLSRPTQKASRFRSHSWMLTDARLGNAESDVGLHTATFSGMVFLVSTFRSSPRNASSPTFAALAALLRSPHLWGPTVSSREFSSRWPQLLPQTHLRKENCHHSPSLIRTAACYQIYCEPWKETSLVPLTQLWLGHQPLTVQGENIRTSTTEKEIQSSGLRGWGCKIVHHLHITVFLTNGYRLVDR